VPIIYLTSLADFFLSRQIQYRVNDYSVS